MDRIRAIWTRWRIRRAERLRQHEERHWHAGQTVYSDSPGDTHYHPADKNWRHGASSGGGGGC
jgi:hypothetical protein